LSTLRAVISVRIGRTSDASNSRSRATVRCSKTSVPRWASMKSGSGTPPRASTIDFCICNSRSCTSWSRCTHCERRVLSGATKDRVAVGGIRGVPAAALAAAIRSAGRARASFATISIRLSSKTT
jgi:hypothetical protein